MSKDFKRWENRRKMDRLGYLLVIALPLCAVKLISGLTLSSTATTEANVGDTVEFMCRVTGLSFSSQQVKWAKIGNKNARFIKDISHHINVIYREGHYEVTATEEGEDKIYTFKINDVSTYDDGAFKCFVEEEGRVIDETKVSLTVRQPVASLELFLGPYKVDSSSPGTQEFEMDQFDPNLVTRCLVEGSNPAPQVTFKIGEEDITSQLKRSDQKQVKGTDLESVRNYIVDLDSTGTYPLDTSVLHKTISCSAWLNGDEANKLEAQALLKVKEQPKVECINVTAQEGDRHVTLECTVRSPTTPERIRWFVDDTKPHTLPATGARRWEYRAKQKQDGENQVNVLLTIDWIEKKHFDATYVLTVELSHSEIEHAVHLHFSARPLEVRLVNGSSPRAGRVEVYYNDTWGTVCDDDWDNWDAQVVCRMLDFPTRGAEVRRGDFFGKGTGPIHLSNVNCLGNEANILQCSHNGTSICNHSEDAGVVCPDPQPLNVRLVNGASPRAGRVEIYYNNAWGTVCFSGFGARGAQVVCRMLGLPTDGAMVHSNFGKGTGPIHLRDVKCRGRETNLLQCSHSETTICNPLLHAGVVCPDRHPLKVRLVNGPNPRAGRVEVYYNNAWGTVCGDHWGHRAAQVVCRMLGFTTGETKLRYNEFFGKGTGPIHLSYVKCVRSEANLRQCAYSGTTICDHSEDVGVVCPGPSVVTTPHSCVGTTTAGPNEETTGATIDGTTAVSTYVIADTRLMTTTTISLDRTADDNRDSTAAVSVNVISDTPLMSATTSSADLVTKDTFDRSTDHNRDGRTTDSVKGRKLTSPTRKVVVMTREAVYMDGQALFEGRAAMATMCARTCTSDDRCVRFNYNQVTQGCRIFSKDAEVSNKTNPDWVVWEVFVVPQK